MKNLDLNSYGVQEMDAKAMEEANGGGIIDYFMEHWPEFKKGFMDGFRKADRLH